MDRPKPGSYWKRHYYDIVIYGYAMTEEEFLSSERALGADGEELDIQRKAFRRWLAEGRIWGKAWSVACPGGEYGSTPIRSALAISKEEFENAQQDEWKD